MTSIAPRATENSDDVWGALADPTRRALIDRLAHGPKSTSELCLGLQMTRFGVMKHLDVLERAGIIVTRKLGRVRLNHLNAAILVAATTRWLAPRALAWARAARNFSEHAGDAAMSEPLPVTRLASVDIALDWAINAPRERAWRAFVESPDLWWPHTHRAVGGVFAFDATLGGRLTETDAAGAGVVWYEVYGLSPGAFVDLRGALAARYGGPATSLLHIEFEADTPKSCVLRLTDSVFGRLGPEFGARVESGWNAIFAGFVSHMGETMC